MRPREHDGKEEPGDDGLELDRRSGGGPHGQPGAERHRRLGEGVLRKLRPDPAAGLVAFEEQLFERFDPAALPEPEIEPGSQARVPRKVFAQRRAEGLGKSRERRNRRLLEETPMGERVVRQDALAEGVNGRDAGHVEGEERLLEEPPGFRIDRPAVPIGNRRRRFAPAAAQELLELGADAVRQLAGRLVREGCEDLLDRQFPDEQELQDEVLEGIGLPVPARPR